MGDKATIGSAVLDRLYRLGVRHIFGIPGDYVLSLYQLIEASPITHIGTTREDCAGFAADAYARINGIGAVCVTYCVGGLNTVNAIACAYAERSPVVLLTGSPGLSERTRTPYLHHMVRDFATQREVFERMTVAAVTLDDPLTAEREMDRAFAALLRYRRPIYIEIPRDMVHCPLTGGMKPFCIEDTPSDPAALEEAISEVRIMLASAKRPAMLVGAEVGRFGLQDDLARLVERLNIPIASTLLGKSIIREDHPLYVGVYGGLIGREEVQQFINESDCLLLLGSILSDVEDLDATSPLLSEGRTIHATADRVAIKHHRYESIKFQDFVQGLVKSPLPSFSHSQQPFPAQILPVPATPDPDAPVTLGGLFRHLDTVLTEKTVVIADVGESLFAAADLHVRHRFEFLSPAYYTSMGFAVPAALGASFADPSLRPIVLVGDGAFQMTGTELASCVRYGQAPIVIILNNRGYSTEREILEGPFNDVHEWQYDKVCDLIGGGRGSRVSTQREFEQNLAAAFADPSRLHVLNVLLSPNDRSPGMVRLARRLGKKLSTDKP
ncbi:alpha-keto acid decarboxylase family protein [Candidatus Nitrospira nitrificans]|uniref:Putative Pyruvate decarboxylase n=1 Tax=Candidatus Nitrospira nitrificans TaxID=1742973 RepID=A0A0S4L5T9_9BACT|nr:thiamine pyrophosphate-binding protein [Candidatus Nitrospira nitrificans]CUS33132.1 putative Pyruvate decarboxylase [Candidatus Nitrospira nitrificans]